MAAPQGAGADLGGAAGRPTGRRGPRAPDGPAAVEEPVWLVRALIVLFLVGFSAYLAQQAWLLLR